MNQPKHITVGIITCQRPKGLEKLLRSLAQQSVPSGYTFSAIVIDNDGIGHNQEIVDKLRQDSPLEIHFRIEAEPGIPAARNASVRTAIEIAADAMIFVDDDEVATADWLTALLATWEQSGADIVTGPVKAYLPDDCPVWAQKSGVYDRIPSRAEGEDVRIAFTNNTLVSKSVLHALGEAFSERFRYTGSSDLHYFTLARKQGFRMVWSKNALVEEAVPISRISFAWLAKRGFRNGGGMAISHMLLRPGSKTIIKLCCASGIWILGGLGKLVLSPVAGWGYFASGIKETAMGIGCLSGLCGFHYQEYKTIHGE
jgi:succinoglycan biosynthesis protein ExoM